MSATTFHERYREITVGPPPLSDAQVRTVLRRGFGRDACTLRRLPGETDTNVHVVDVAEAQYVLKVADAAEQSAAQLQNAVLDQVRDRDPHLPVPRVVGSVDSATDGGTVVMEVDGERVVARLLTWLPGVPLAEVTEFDEDLLADIGATAGRLAAATARLADDGHRTSHYWDLGRAGDVIAGCLPHVRDPGLRADVERVWQAGGHVVERLPDLPTAVVHHDLNALNVLVEPDRVGRRVCGIIDFGDLLRAPRVADLAILLASVMRSSHRPLWVAGVVAGAYHERCPLTEEELDAVYPLALVRAATVAVTTARLAAEDGHGDRRHRSSAPAELLRTLLVYPVASGAAAVRRACGLPRSGPGDAVRAWLAEHRTEIMPVVAGEVRPVDMSASSEAYDDADPRNHAELREAARVAIAEAQAEGSVVVGRHGEPRFLAPVRRSDSGERPNDIHLGIDLFALPGSPVCAPLAGTAEVASGDELLVKHEPAGGAPFWTFYRGVVPEAAGGVAAGQRIGRAADGGYGDGLPSRVHVQLAAFPPSEWGARPTDVPGDDLTLWEAVFLDPSPLLGPGERVRPWAPTIDATLDARRRHLPDTHPTYFRRPISMVRARGCWFYDERGRAYLDSLNNVTLLGHCHPRLVRAAERQLRRLNTNSRFVYDVLTEYVERLTATLPDGLDVVYLTNSGSEANDLALRMARFVTGRSDFVIIDDAYHGNTALACEVSPSRYRNTGKPDTTHPTPVPDRYRGEYGYDDPQAGPRYAQHTIETFGRLAADGRPAAAYLYETVLAGGGQVVLPPGYLPPITEAARAGGVLTIADEVQVGFGRLGEALWGFETQSVVPDFVTMGKSMGNGFPVAAMVTTREISQAFDPSGKYFSTYGGNPVSCAVGLELLNVLADEGLQDNARVVGAYWRDRLTELADRHELIGDVRGQGLYAGVELVRDRATKEPAVEETLAVCERLKDEGVLVYPTGKYWNVLKLKPPLCFTADHADLFAEVLDRVLERS